MAGVGRGMTGQTALTQKGVIGGGIHVFFAAQLRLEIQVDLAGTRCEKQFGRPSMRIVNRPRRMGIRPITRRFIQSITVTGSGGTANIRSRELVSNLRLGGHGRRCSRGRCCRRCSRGGRCCRCRCGGRRRFTGQLPAVAPQHQKSNRQQNHHFAAIGRFTAHGRRGPMSDGRQLKLSERPHLRTSSSKLLRHRRDPSELPIWWCRAGWWPAS